MKPLLKWHQRMHAICQIGHALSRIIHAFAESGDNKKEFMAKWDIKDGFWRMDCAAGKEWNFAYILPQAEGEAVRLMVPTSLQMGWIKLPPIFYTASEMAQDILAQYIEMPVGMLLPHKFEQKTQLKGYMEEQQGEHPDEGFKYLLKIFVDNYMSLVITRSKEVLQQVSMTFSRHKGRTMRTTFH